MNQSRYIADRTLFCYFLGSPVSCSIPVDISDPTKVDNVDVPIKNLTFGHIKKLIWPNDEKAIELKLWRVEISREEKKEMLDALNKYFRENVDMTDVLGEELDAADPFPVDYKPPPKTIHIIVQPPSPATTVSSMYIPSNELELKTEIKNKVIKTFSHMNPYSIDQLVDALALIWHIEALECDLPATQDDPCFKLRIEPSFFKISLPSAITQQSTTPVDLCLPPYESKSGMNYLNPFYDDPQFIDTVSLVREKLINNPRDITVLAGVSGGGKTSAAFGISIQRWTIYIDFAPSVKQYANSMGEELGNIRAIPPKYGQIEEQSKVFDMLNLEIISHGLLLIKMLVQEKISTPKEWLIAQLRTNVSTIKKTLHSNKTSISYNLMSLIDDINACLNVKSLILIFDEAQVLCDPKYGEYDGSSMTKSWNLLQAYIEHLTLYSVTCLIAGTYMHMASGLSFVNSIGKVGGSHAHIVLKLPFLSQNDVLRNLEAVIDLTDVTSETRNYLTYVLRGRPRNCASFVRKLISNRNSTNRTKDQEMQKLIRSWIVDMSSGMADYLDNTCKYVGANYLHPEKAIMDVLRLHVFYNQKFGDAIELLKHSIIPCMSPECVTVSHRKTYKNVIEFNPSFESYLVPGIEEFFLRKGKSLIDVFIDNIILLNNTSSIGVRSLLRQLSRNVGIMYKMNLKNGKMVKNLTFLHG